MKKTLLILTCALAMMASAQEENSSPAQTIDGRPVSRVTFDRETVTIYYTDGTEQTVDQATIVRTNRVTGITTVKTDDSMPAGKNSDGIFDLQGRRVDERNLTAGIYVKRIGNKAVKFVKH